MKIKSLLQRKPVPAYFFLAYLISWGGAFLVGGPKFLRGEAIPFEDLLDMGALVLAGPFISGIAMSFLADGKAGVRELFSRMGKWRVGGGWYATTLIFPILLLIVLPALSRLVSPDFAPHFYPGLIVLGLMAGFVEETGWMGFAYPRMRSRYGVLRAAIYLAILHGIWHVMADYLGSSRAFGIYWMPRFFAMWMVGMAAMRIILVWVYTNTGSLLMAQLIHASSTGFLLVLSPAPAVPANETLWFAVYAVVLWAAAGVVLAVYGRNLDGRPVQRKTDGLTSLKARG